MRVCMFVRVRVRLRASECVSMRVCMFVRARATECGCACIQ